MSGSVAASQAPDRRAVMRIPILALAINAALAGTKLGVGLAGHSYALLADALESLTDIASSLVVLGGLRVASRPPDEEHPYGHGKAEALAALFVAGMLWLAGIAIAVGAVRGIVLPREHRDPPHWYTLWVLIGVIVIKEGIFRLLRRTARSAGSAAVLADAWHNRADAITSLAAGIGLTIALVGGPGYQSADSWGALAASGLVLYNAWGLVLTPLRELMDAAPTELVDRVRAAAAAVPGVIDVEKVLARKSGPSYHVDMHLHVDGGMSLHHAHALSGKVKAAVRTAVPQVADVLIHVEPASGGDVPSSQ